MASFEKRGNTVRAVVYIGGAKKTASFDTEAEAKLWAARMERLKVAPDREEAGGSLTVGDMLEAYEVVAADTDSGRWNTLRINAMLRDPLSKRKLAAITTHDINQWLTRRMAEPSNRTGKSVAPSTAQRDLNLLSAAFTWAAKARKWITVNPCHGCERVAGNKRTRKPKTLTQAQIDAICQATGFSMDPQLRTKTARVGAAWLLALETGMRSGEILRIRPEDYWRDRKTVHVAAIDRGGRKASKSGRATVDPSRHVPLTDRAIELLDLLLATMPEEQEQNEELGLMNPPYVVGLNDRQRDALWRKAREKAGMGEFTFHDAKHEAATRLSKFLDPLALSHAIGTKDIRLLRDTYYISDASRAAALLPSRLMAAPPTDKGAPRWT